jgi:hypothetical protein
METTQLTQTDINLSAIDDAISLQVTNLAAIAEQLLFKELFTFELSENPPSIPEQVSKKKGIYFFQLKNEDLQQSVIDWAASFKTIWESGNVVWVPGIKKTRLHAHKTFGEWVPLYIGKSKNVGGRIYEHINQVRDKTTFSMKLKARANMHGSFLKVSWVPLDVVNYDLIAPALEFMLRNQYNPIVGKQ